METTLVHESSAVRTVQNVSKIKMLAAVVFERTEVSWGRDFAFYSLMIAWGLGHHWHLADHSRIFKFIAILMLWTLGD